MSSAADDPTASSTAPNGPPPAAGVWSPDRRPLTIGLVLAVTLVAFESLAVATVMPAVEADLGDLALYGWVFSGFFLASLLGIVVAGQLADRRGPALPFGLALACFAVGLAVGGGASSMAVLVTGRVVQGLGSGAVGSVAYTAIARGYPPALRPRMFATASTAWVVPGMVGPAIATAVEHATSWRVVFLGLVPLVAVAAITVLPPLARLGVAVPAAGAADERERTGEAAAGVAATSDRARLGWTAVLVAGVAAAFAAADVAVAVGAVLAVVGGVVAVSAFARLVPAGTLRVRPGVPAAVAVRGVLTCAFFSSDAYISLAVTDGRGAAPWVAGAALSSGALAWAVGSWLQARWIEAIGARRLVRSGFAAIVAGIAVLAAVAAGAPVGLALAAWAVGGFGMGLAYAPLSLAVLAEAAPGEEGAASASIQLADMLGIAVGTGLSGAVVALGQGRGWAVDRSTVVVFGLSALIGVVGLAVSRRLAGPAAASGVGHQPVP